MSSSLSPSVSASAGLVGPQLLAGRILALLGGALALGGWRWADTLGGGLAWAGGALIACAGYGSALALALRYRRGQGVSGLWAARHAQAGAAGPPPLLPLTVTLGLVTLILLGTGLGHLGLFSATVVRALVALGLLLALVLPPRVEAPRAPMAVGGVLALGFVLACLRLAGEGRVVSDDDINHLGALARLWQTGAFPPMQQQLGGQLVGEAVFSLGIGSWAPFFFDGICGLLVFWLMTERATRREDGFAMPVLVIVFFWMLLLEQSSVAIICRWPSALLHVALFSWLRDRDLGLEPDEHEERVQGLRRVVVLGLGLCSLRFELVPVALIYVAAAFARDRLPTWSRRDMVRAAAAAVLVLAGVGVLGGNAIPLALGKAAACLVAVPVALLLLLFLGSFRWWSAPGLALIAVGAGFLAASLSLTPPGSRSVAVVLAVALHAPLLAALLVERAAFSRWGTPVGRAVGTSAAGRLYPLVAAAMVMTIFLHSLWPLALHHHFRSPFTTRFVDFIDRLERLGTTGGDSAIDQRMRRLQHRIPAGARLGVWGKSAGRLDYRRNPITDVSWSPATGRRVFLAGITRKQLAELDYLVVEAFVRTRWRDYVVEDEVVKATHSVPTIFVEDQLELVAAEGWERLYKVRR